MSVDDWVMSIEMEQQLVEDASKDIEYFNLKVHQTSTRYGDSRVPLQVMLVGRPMFRIYVKRDNIKGLTFEDLYPRASFTDSYEDDRLLSHEYVYDCAIDEKPVDKKKLEKLIIADQLK